MASAPINPTALTPPRVELIDPRTGAISREWYRFFLSLLNATETNQQGTNTTPDTSALLASYDAMLADLAQEVQAAPDVSSAVSSLSEKVDDLSQAFGVAPPPLSSTVTSVDVSGGATGLTFSGGPITTSGTITMAGTLGVANGGTNLSATPTNGQLLIGNGTNYTLSTLTAGTGISVSNGAGSVTITNTAPDQIVSLTAGTAISITGTYPSFTISNTAPDQIVSLTGAGTTSISGTYPNFTITSNDAFVGTVTSVSGTGTVNGITLTGTVTSSGSLTLGGTLSGVSLTTQVTGTLPVGNGGTGATTLSSGYLIKGNGVSAVSASVAYDNGTQILVGTTTATAASVVGLLQAESEIFSKGSSAGFFFENRSGGVTSGSNWYGWYNTGGTTYFYNPAVGNIASIDSATGVYTALSDAKKKKDFEPSSIGLKAILALKPTLYRMDTDSADAPKQLGFVAQEVKHHIPQAYVEQRNIDAGGTDATYIGLNDRPIIAALVKAVQELSEQIATLKKGV